MGAYLLLAEEKILNSLVCEKLNSIGVVYSI